MIKKKKSTGEYNFFDLYKKDFHSCWQDMSSHTLDAYWWYIKNYKCFYKVYSIKQEKNIFRWEQNWIKVVIGFISLRNTRIKNPKG